MHKAPLTLALFVTVLVGSGCWWKTYHAGASAGKIEEGRTTRTELSQAFGEPAAETPDGRFALYVYSGEVTFSQIEDRVRTVGVRKTHHPYTGRVLLEFDNNDRVKHEYDSTCGPGYERLCDPDPTASLLAMLGWHYDAALARKYEVPIARCRAFADAWKRGHRYQLRALLVDDSADVNVWCQRGARTPLHEAAAQGDLAIVQRLLAQGAKVDASDRYGFTPLQWATFRRHPTVVEALLAQGANANSKDLSGWTPLHEAASQGDLPVVKALLIGGADVGVRRNDGRTPIDLATDPKVIELLARYAAKQQSRERKRPSR